MRTRLSLAAVRRSLTNAPAFGVTEEIIPSAAFTFADGLSTRALTRTSSPAAVLSGLKTLAKGGLRNMRRVTGAPAALGEWRIVGASLDIFGDVTASGDEWTVTYPTDE